MLGNQIKMMAGIVKEKMAVETLAEITRREVERYVGYSPEAECYPILDDVHRTYTVVMIPHWPRKYPAGMIVMARVVDDQVIIEEETTDKPLVEALMVNGNVPREQIVLAYAGETLHDAVT